MSKMKRFFNNITCSCSYLFDLNPKINIGEDFSKIMKSADIEGLKNLDRLHELGSLEIDEDDEQITIVRAI